MTGALLFCLLWPLVVSLWTWVWRERPDLRDYGMVALAAVQAPVLFLTIGSAVWAGERPGMVLSELFPGQPLAFEVEPLGLIYAGIAALLWPITALYAIGYLRGHHEEHQARFFVFFSAAISAAMGIAFAADLLTLFVFYEVLTLSTWPLVTHHQDAAAKRAGRIYLGILLSTSVGLFLAGIALTWALAGRVDFVPGGILEGHVDTWTAAGLLALFAFGHRQGRHDARPQVAAQRDGRAHAGLGVAARGRRREGGRVHDPQGRHLHLRHRAALRPRTRACG